MDAAIFFYVILGIVFACVIVADAGWSPRKAIVITVAWLPILVVWGLWKIGRAIVTNSWYKE